MSVIPHNLEDEAKEDRSFVEVKENCVVRGYNLLWTIIEVETVGEYSPEQYNKYMEYSNSSTCLTFIGNTLRISGVVFILCIGNQNLPLLDPSYPVEQQYVYFIINFTGFSIAAHTIVTLYKVLFPELKLTYLQSICLSIPYGMIAAAILLLAASIVGLPIPGASNLPQLPSLPALIIPLYLISRNKLHEVQQYRRRVRNLLILVVVVMLCTKIYPLLTLALKSTTSDILTILVTFAFPLIKYLTRYVLFHLLNDATLSFSGIKNDLAPTICVFTIEFFNSFYLSVMIQDGVNWKAILSLILIDISTNVHFVSILGKYGPQKTRKSQLATGNWSLFKALHVSEFVILTEFVECLVPALYGVVSLGLYYGPNRRFFPQLDALTQEQFFELLQKYAILMAVELIVLIMILLYIYHQLRLNLINQINFVLSKHWYLTAILISLFIIFTLSRKKQWVTKI